LGPTKAIGGGPHSPYSADYAGAFEKFQDNSELFASCRIRFLTEVRHNEKLL